MFFQTFKLENFLKSLKSKFQIRKLVKFLENLWNRKTENLSKCEKHNVQMRKLIKLEEKYVSNNTRGGQR